MLNTLRRAFARTRSNEHPRVPTPRLETSEGMPPNVHADLDHAIVHVRNCDTEGARRVVVQLPGSHPWFDGADETRKAIALRYPELNSGQLDIATTYLRRYVRAHVRVAKRRARGRDWVNSWRGED